MSGYNRLLKNIVYKFNHQNIITEGIEEIKKYFPKLEDKKLRELISLDPTYKGGEQLGKYGQWIIRLFYNNIKNDERLADYKELLKKFPDGINPKTNQPFAPPTKLPEVKEEDLYKVKESLKLYDMLKKNIGKPIDVFKTLADLDSAIGSVKDTGVPQNEKALKRYNLFKKAFKVGMKPVYEDNQFIVGCPDTLESSVLFGDDTRWCTTAPNGTMYNHYTKDGKLYIILEKQTGDLFQFHFESDSYMNEFDRSIDIDEFTEKYENLCKHIYDYKVENELKTGSTNSNKIIKAQDAFKKCLENLQLFQQEILNDPTGTNIKVENGYICFQVDVSDIDCVYNENYRSRDVIPLKTIEEVLNGEYDYDYWSDYSLDERRSSIVYYWDKFKDKFGIKESWDDFLDLAQENEELEEILNDNWYDGMGLQIVLDDADRSGYENELYNDIVEGLKDDLPLDSNNPNNYNNLNFKIEIERFWETFLMLKLGLNGVKLPEWARDFSYKTKEIQYSLGNMDKLRDFNTVSWMDDCKNEVIDDYYFDENWLKQYRMMNYDGLYEDYDFCLTYKDYGYTETDEKMIEEAFEDAMPRIKAVLDKSN